MVDPPAVAVFYSIQDLKEYALGKIVLTDILSAFCDIVEEITLWAVLQDNEDAVRAVDDLQHGHHVGVGRSIPVQADLPGLEGHLSLVQRGSIGVELAERLDGIPDVGEYVDSRVDHSVCACTQNPVQPERPCQAAS